MRWHSLLSGQPPEVDKEPASMAVVTMRDSLREDITMLQELQLWVPDVTMTC